MTVDKIVKSNTTAKKDLDEVVQRKWILPFQRGKMHLTSVATTTCLSSKITDAVTEERTELVQAGVCDDERRRLKQMAP